MSGVPLGYYYGLKFEKGDIAQIDHSYARPFQSLVHHNKSLKTKPKRLLQQDYLDDSNKIDNNNEEVCFSYMHN